MQAEIQSRKTGPVSICFDPFMLATPKQILVGFTKPPTVF